MGTVGIRELTKSLSEYIRRIRAGETAPGASKSDPSVPAGLATLARRGLATVGSGSTADLYRPLPRKRRGNGTSAQLLDEERASR